MTIASSSRRILHAVGENISHAVSFAELLGTSESLSSITSITDVPASSLTTAAGTASGTVANVRYSAGTAEESYNSEVKCLTDAGNTISGDVEITVTNFPPAPRRYQQASESLVWSIDFEARLDSGETLSAISSVVSSPTGPTISGSVINGTAVEFRTANPTKGEQHRIKVLVTTSASNTRREDLLLTGL